MGKYRASLPAGTPEAGKARAVLSFKTDKGSRLEIVGDLPAETMRLIIALAAGKTPGELFQAWLKKHDELVLDLAVTALEDGACGLACGHHPLTEQSEAELNAHARALAGLIAPGGQA